MFEDLGIQHAMRMRHFYCRMCPVPLYIIVPHYLKQLSNGVIKGPSSLTKVAHEIYKPDMQQKFSFEY